MKTGKKIMNSMALAFLLLLGTLSLKAQQYPYDDVYDGDVNFQTFYDDLSPYGQWVNNSQYGQVWVPNAGQDFQPYGTAGHWEMTEYGNTWVSDYPWGWAPFHYGRWVLDNYYGWIWVPGYEWGPAWVSWRTGGGYYGWAPLGPGMSINVSVNLPWNYWTFVPQSYILSARIYNYYVPRARIGNLYNSTIFVNNFYRNNNRIYAAGPGRYDMQRAIGRNIDVRRAGDFGRRVGYFDRQAGGGFNGNRGGGNRFDNNRPGGMNGGRYDNPGAPNRSGNNGQMNRGMSNPNRQGGGFGQDMNRGGNQPNTPNRQGGGMGQDMNRGSNQPSARGGQGRSFDGNRSGRSFESPRSQSSQSTSGGSKRSGGSVPNAGSNRSSQSRGEGRSPGRN
ncbi:MAG: hypothetical protein QM669_04875 [Siphonobacter sp.]